MADGANDETFMRAALDEARYALDCGEVPIGAVVVFQDQIIGRGFNRPITERDPTAHAEIVAIREAARKIGNYRLIGSTIYTTIEPCAMCAGALVNARLARLVYGAADARAGGVRSVFQICASNFLNHRVEVTSGVLEEECRELIQSFFKQKRSS